MQCNFSGTKEHVAMETSTHGRRERGRREREQQRRGAAPLAQEEQPPDPPSYWQEWLFVCWFSLIPPWRCDGEESDRVPSWPNHYRLKKIHSHFLDRVSLRAVALLPRALWICCPCKCMKRLSTLDKRWVTPKLLVVSWWVEKVKLVCCFRKCNKGIYFNLWN